MQWHLGEVKEQCLEEGPVDTVSQREVEIELNVNVYPNSAIFVTHLVQEEAARARVRCA